MGVPLYAEKLTRTPWLLLIASVLLFAGVFAIAALIPWLFSGASGGIRVMLFLIPIFGLFGAIYGTIFAFDSGAGKFQTNRPVLRAALSAVFGVVFWSYLHAQGFVAVNAGIVVFVAFGFGFLGWLGWRWAEYVDFQNMAQQPVPRSGVADAPPPRWAAMAI